MDYNGNLLDPHGLNDEEMDENRMDPNPNGLKPVEMMEVDNVQIPLVGLNEEKKPTIDDLPNEVLAFCLSFTGEFLPIARRTCKRFNQIVVKWNYMMNVIPLSSIGMILEKESNTITIIQKLCKIPSLKVKYRKVSCNEKEVAIYLNRFYRPGYLTLEGFEDVESVKKWMKPAWIKAVNKMKVFCRGGLSTLHLFSNVEELEYVPQHPLTETPVMAQICAALPCIRLLSMFHHYVENDSSLDILLEKTNSSSHGLEYLDIYGSTFSIKAVLRFIEKGKFAKKFSMTLTVDDIDGYQHPAYYEMRKWIQTQQSNELLKLKSSNEAKHHFNFDYRSTQYSLFLREPFTTDNNNNNHYHYHYDIQHY